MQTVHLRSKIQNTINLIIISYDKICSLSALNLAHWVSVAAHHHRQGTVSVGVENVSLFSSFPLDRSVHTETNSEWCYSKHNYRWDHNCNHSILTQSSPSLYSRVWRFLYCEHWKSSMSLYQYCTMTSSKIKGTACSIY